MVRWPGRHASTGAAVLAALTWPAPAASQQAVSFELAWNGPSGCPSANDVRARVEELLGEGASSSSVADVRASGQVERLDTGFRLLLTMGVGSAPSSRVIEARTCDELAGAAAIAIALLARSSAESASGDSPSGSPGASPSQAGPQDSPATKPSEPADPEEDPKSHAERAGDGLRFVLDAPVAVASWGTLPSVSFGLGGGLGIRWKSLRVVARGELWQPQTSEVAGFATRFTLQSGRTEACLMQSGAWLELGPCLGFALQRLQAAGIASEVFSAQSRTSLWASGVGAIFASVATPGFARLRFFGTASVLVSPVRPRYVIDQLGLAHEPALAAPQLDLGCEWIF